MEGKRWRFSFLKFQGNAHDTLRIVQSSLWINRIVNLLNDALRYRKSHNAIGQKEFAKFLRGLNTQRNFVGNDNFWESPEISEDDKDKEETLLFRTEDR